MISFSPPEIAVYYATRAPDLLQRGKRWRGRCSIHGGNHDSFSVDPETGLWRCWSICGRGGDIITLEMELTGAAWRNAVQEIERIIGRALLERPMSHAERRAFAGRWRGADAAADEIDNWQTGMIPEANARKLAAVDARDDDALKQAASLCNVLENGPWTDIVCEFIRHRKSDPPDVVRLIGEGRNRKLEGERIAAEAVLLLARADELERTRDAA